MSYRQIIKFYEHCHAISISEVQCSRTTPNSEQYKSTNLVPLVNLEATLDNRRTLEDTDLALTRRTLQGWRTLEDIAPSPSPEDIQALEDITT